MGIGSGLVLPCLNTIITSAASSEERGLVTSLYGSVRFFGVALGPAVFGMLLERGRSVTFLSVGALTGIATILCFFFLKVQDIKKGKKDQQQGQNKDPQSKETKSFQLPSFGQSTVTLRKPLPDKYFPKEKNGDLKSKLENSEKN